MVNTLKSRDGMTENNGTSEKKKSTRDRRREYIPRDSMLTDMMQVGHLKTVYNMIVAHVIIECLRTVLLGLADGKLDIGQDFIMWNFGKLHLVLMLWLAMTGVTLGIYGAFWCWATRLDRFAPRFSAWNLWSWDCLWLGGYVAYQTGFFYFPAVAVIKWKLPPISTVIIVFEQIRMAMKSHSFVRSNAPRVIAHKPGSETSTWPGPGFSHFLYFLFCPTLVYRDNYPRTHKVRWWFVFKHLLEMVGAVLYFTVVLQRWIKPLYTDWGLAPSSPQQIINMAFSTVFPALAIFLCTFYVILHVSQGIGAELTCFADRMFYQDWWTAESYGIYFRKWNILIHDWLYTYIYRDLQERFRPSGRTLPALSVFLISGIVHEYILAMVLGFCYPVVIFMFVGIGGSLSLLPSNHSIGGNTVFWLLMMIGNTLYTTLFSLEWYARINCTQTQDGLLDFFTPRSWNCSPLSSTFLPSL